MEEAGGKIEGGEESPFHGVNKTSVSHWYQQHDYTRIQV